MSDVVDFRQQQIKRLANAQGWSVLECLKDAVNDIETGKLAPDMCVVTYRVPMGEPDANGQFPFRIAAAAAGCDTLQILGLLQMHEASITFSRG